MPTDFTLPELGENVAAGDVLRVLVKPGDVITQDQPVLELETDKATIEVPSSVAGRVKDVKVKAGDKVKVGQSILTVDSAAAPEADAAAKQEPKGAAPQPKAEEKVAEATPSTLPSGGAEADPAAGAAERLRPTTGSGRPEQQVEVLRTGSDKLDYRSTGAGRLERQVEGRGGGAPGEKVVAISRGARQTAEQPAAPELPVAPAAPSVRRMARELGVDIDKVPGSGGGGRISIEDVKAHAKRLITEPAAGVAAVPAEPLPDFTRWGEIDRQPMRAVRRKTAEHLSAAWAAVPHVTQHDLADITGLEELRKRYAKQAEAAGGSLTITAIAVKVVAAALKVFPQFNSSIDLAADQIIYKKYVNVGVAVDTDRGLLVPVIRNADAKNLVQLSVELSQLSEKARARKISLDEMQGGCFSISNLGGIGGSFFTPIVNAPEVAILGISRARMEPVWRPRPARGAGGERGAAAPPSASERGWGPASIDNDEVRFVPRLMLPLSLSYDHRVIDGADAVRFLRWVVEALEQPFVLALQG